MARRPMQSVLERIRQVLGGVPEESDGDLLTRFATGQDEAAFETLLVRHGPMVLEVARRVLQHAQDAEDVFQVTFVVLAQQAHSIRKRASVASWLYGVAYRTALRARSRRLRRIEMEKTMPTSTSGEPSTEASRAELEPLLGEEVNRLPEKFRSAVVLCYFEGKSREQAAEALGWSTDTVKGRLERGRNLLRERLTRRGAALSAAAVATALEQSATAAPLPHALFENTLRLAILGGGEAATALSGSAATLLNGVLNEMYWHKIKTAVALFLAATVMVGGGGWLAHRTFAGPTDGLVAVAPDPIRDNPAADREVNMPLDGAIVHRDQGRNHPDAAVVAANTGGDHRHLGTAFTEAHELGRVEKVRVPLGGNLSILSAGPQLDSPDHADVQRFVRKGKRLELEVNYTRARAEGVSLRQNIIWQPLVQVPIDLPVGEYELEVSWHAVALTPATGNFKPQPVKTQKVVFSIFEGLAYSKPLRVGELEYATFVDARMAAPPAGGKRPVNFGLRVTNHGKDPVDLPTPSQFGPEGIKPVEGKALDYSGGRDGLRAGKPVMVPPGRTVHLFMHSATLIWDKDGKTLQLSGMDRTAFFFHYKAFSPAKYTVRLGIPGGGEGKTEPVPFEVVEKP